MKDLELIDESGFPRGVKKLLNECAKRLNRPIEVKFDSNAGSPDVLETEDKVVIVIPGSLVKDVIFSFNGTLYYLDIITAGVARLV